MKKIITYLTIFILIFNVIFTLNINSVQAYTVEIDPEDYITMPLGIYGNSGTIRVDSSLTSSYELYYQYVDISDSLFNQILAKNDEAQKYVDEEKPKLEEEEAELQTLKTEYENIFNDSTKTEEEKEEARNRYNTAVEEYNSHVNTIKNKIQEFNEAINGLKPSYVESNWTKTTDGSFEIDTSNYIGEFHIILWAKLVTQDGTYYDEQIYSTQGTKEITISLDKTKATMEVGDTLKLTATTNSSDNITWSSNKTDIATVSSDGTVTAKAEGVATITATVGEKSATCTVTVNKPSTETSETITINKSSASVKVDETVQLTATSSTNSNITWTSSDSTIATVSSSGLVKGIKEGTAVITAKGSEKSATCTVTVTSKETTGGDEDDIEWTDFSNAKFELKKDGYTDSILEISNFTPINKDEYYICISPDNGKPEIDFDYFDSPHDFGWLFMRYDDEKKILTARGDELDHYVVLNQDLYVSILEKDNDTQEQKVVIHGKKVERFAENKYSDAFHATMISDDWVQIVSRFTHDGKNSRNMQVKVGKITDIDILRKIKNEDSSGFADLLSFAKSNNGIYDKIVKTRKDYYSIAYEAGSSSSYEEATGNSIIDLSGHLDKDAYYFLYVKTEDENGKYISNEAVTLGQLYEGYMNDNWYISFYGSDDFEWADFGTTPNPDDTTSKDPLPNAGLNTIMWITAGVALVGVFSYKQYRKNNF